MMTAHFIDDYEVKNMKIHKIDHVSINVNDYAAAKAFFLILDWNCKGKTNWKVASGWINSSDFMALKQHLLFLRHRMARPVLNWSNIIRPQMKRAFSLLLQIR